MKDYMKDFVVPIFFIVIMSAMFGVIGGRALQESEMKQQMRLAFLKENRSGCFQVTKENDLRLISGTHEILISF